MTRKHDPLTNWEEKQAYIDEMTKRRGYVLDHHVIAEHDREVLQATNRLVSAATHSRREPRVECPWAILAYDLDTS